MKDKQTYFSLAIDEPSRVTLNAIAKLHKLSQSEVIEAMLSCAESDYMNLVFAQAAADKKSTRDINAKKREALRKAMSKLSAEEMEEILNRGDK